MPQCPHLENGRRVLKSLGGCEIWMRYLQTWYTVCVCVCARAHVCMYVSACTHMHARAPTCVHACVHTHVCVHVRACVYMCACMRVCVCVCVRVSTCACAQSRLTLCDPVGHCPPGSSVHGIGQGRVLQWVATFSSK